MADANWRTNKDIQLAKQVAREKGAGAVVLIMFKSDGQFSVVSYGTNGDKCIEAGKIADQIHELISTEVIDTLDLSKALSRK